MMESIKGFYKETVQISSRKHMNSFGSGVYGFCSFKMLNCGFKPDSTRIISNLTPSKLNELILKIMTLEKVSPASSMASFWVSMFNFVGVSLNKRKEYSNLVKQSLESHVNFQDQECICSVNSTDAH